MALHHKIDAGAAARHADSWVQIIADVTGYPVYTGAEHMAMTLSTALLAGRLNYKKITIIGDTRHDIFGN